MPSPWNKTFISVFFYTVFRIFPGLVATLNSINNQLEDIKRQNYAVLNQNVMIPLWQAAVTPTQLTVTYTQFTSTDLTVTVTIT